MSRKPKGLQNTREVRLYPTREQGCLLMAHCQEYISTVNVLASALDADLIPHDETFSTKYFVTALPSCVKNQALRDARSVFKRSLELDVLPVLKKPICQWNNQNWHIKQGMLTVPVSLNCKTQQIHVRCAEVELCGLPGLLRLKKKRGKWIADITMTMAKPKPVEQGGVMGIDLGIKVEQVDAAYTSQKCPAYLVRNKAQDRTYVCAVCGWKGHRDTVGARTISRRAGLSDQRTSATESR